MAKAGLLKLKSERLSSVSKKFRLTAEIFRYTFLQIRNTKYLMTDFLRNSLRKFLLTEQASLTLREIKKDL